MMMQLTKMYLVVQLTEKEKDAVTKISQTGTTFQKINAPLLKKFINLQESLKGVLVSASLKTYNNSKVRAVR